MKSLIEFIRETYQTNEFIPLHAPTFPGNEQAYVAETIASTFVSSVGKFVIDFEHKIESFTGSPKAVATSSGSSALHTALYMAGVTSGDLVITQALTFVATCNTLYHMGAAPIFVDIAKTSLGLSPHAVQAYLEEYGVIDEHGLCTHKETGQIIRALLPMHTFGHPVELDELAVICHRWNLVLIEDAAESLGSFYKGKHTGTVGDFAALSFNGNKIITTGGGGMLLANSQSSGERAKHITTTAKVPHPFEFYHDEPGFNYRMPNLNAALGCAQMESLPLFIEQKRALAKHYQTFFSNSELQFVHEPSYAKSNYWLNAVICPDTQSRDRLLKSTNDNGVMTRPVWQLMHRLPMFKDAVRGSLTNSELIESRLINLPSSPATIGLTHA
ncbi:UDP-bacillosamine synthetase [Shewanella sediminis HAW-EB3]|uniref:UDP-bacillosamine synthetase n=1 Tax=Shewanella sediminis (strain HAW-EB3) TaxID=425104 RepID=A8FXX9_SHESH|nr:UDP-bacillosamine synthetase [Shewanella sediminis HAW-EB3]